MNGLREWETWVDPTPEERLALAERYGGAQHVPTRTCLGCGGSTGDGPLSAWSHTECDGRGVRASRLIGWTADRDRADPLSGEAFALTWAEVRQLLHRGAQLELGW